MEARLLSEGAALDLTNFCAQQAGGSGGFSGDRNANEAETSPGFGWNPCGIFSHL
jgi:hypothetical protein